MIWRGPIARLLGRRSHRSPVAESAARARRARDHLERKRARERQRRERERWQAEHARIQAWLRAGAAPLAFGAALALGTLLAEPASERLLMRSVVLERVAIQGARTLETEALAARAGLVRGRPLASIDPESVCAALATDPWIQSVRALRLPTGTFVLSVVEREAVARWQRGPEEEAWLVDRRGERFDGRAERGPALPLVRGGDASTKSLPPEALALLGQIRGHARLGRDAAALTLRLPASAVEPDTGGIRAGDPSGYVLELGRAGPRALLGRSDLTQRLARLAALLESEAPELDGARWIDLRYADRAVLRTEPVPG